MTKRKIEYWVIPPDQDAEFVADMENVLETYAEAYDPRNPVLCINSARNKYCSFQLRFSSSTQGCGYSIGRKMS